MATEIGVQLRATCASLALEIKCYSFSQKRWAGGVLKELLKEEGTMMEHPFQSQLSSFKCQTRGFTNIGFKVLIN